MDLSVITQSAWFEVVGIPLLICLARIIDVTISTVRIIFVSKGQRLIAPILGFFEIMVWLMAITQVMQHLDHWQNYIAYALGFALGNYFGIYIENKIALGSVAVRIITKIKADTLANELRSRGHSVTTVDAIGNDGEVNIVFTVIDRSKIKEIVPLIKKHNPWAVYSIEDVRYANYAMLNVPVSEQNLNKVKS